MAQSVASPGSDPGLKVPTPPAGGVQAVRRSGRAACVPVGAQHATPSRPVGEICHDWVSVGT